MFAVEIYAAVRRFVFVEEKSRREAARVFGLSRAEDGDFGRSDCGVHIGDPPRIRPASLESQTIDPIQYVSGSGRTLRNATTE
jgi:hypothetical protein